MVSRTIVGGVVDPQISHLFEAACALRVLPIVLGGSGMTNGEVGNKASFHSLCHHKPQKKYEFAWKYGNTWNY